MGLRWLLGIAAFTSLGAALLAAAENNPIVEDLVTGGIAVGPSAKLILPRPTLDDGLSAAEQRRRIVAAAGERQTWDELVRRSVVAPFVLQIDQGGETAKSTGRTVDLGFVAYTSLDRLAGDDFLREQYDDSQGGGETENRPRAKLLAADVLRARAEGAERAR